MRDGRRKEREAKILEVGAGALGQVGVLKRSSEEAPLKDNLRRR